MCVFPFFPQGQTMIHDLLHAHIKGVDQGQRRYLIWRLYGAVNNLPKKTVVAPSGLGPKCLNANTVCVRIVEGSLEGTSVARTLVKASLGPSQEF